MGEKEFMEFWEKIYLDRGNSCKIVNILEYL